MGADGGGFKADFSARLRWGTGIKPGPSLPPNWTGGSPRIQLSNWFMVVRPNCRKSWSDFASTVSAV